MITTLDQFIIKNEEKEYKYYEQPVEYENQQKKHCQEQGYAHKEIKELAKMIRTDLKNKYGNTIKFSVRSKGYPREINVEIKKISTEHLMTKEEFKEYMICSHLFDEQNYENYMKPYNETGEIRKFKRYHLKDDVYEDIMKTINKYNYDNSDPYTDYFDVNYYEHFEFDWEGVTVLEE